MASWKEHCICGNKLGWHFISLIAHSIILIKSVFLTFSVLTSKIKIV